MGERRRASRVMADFIPIPAMRRRVLVTEHDDVRGLLLLLGIVICVLYA